MAESSTLLLHADLAWHVRRASSDDLCETLELLGLAIARRLENHAEAPQAPLPITVGIQLLTRAIRASTRAPKTTAPSPVASSGPVVIH